MQALGRHDKVVEIAGPPRSRSISNHVKARNNRGFQLFLLSRHEEALANYVRAVALDPDFIIAVKNRGLTLHQLNRFAESLRHLDTALARRPGAAELHASRIMALYMLGRFEEALASDRADLGTGSECRQGAQ